MLSTKKKKRDFLHQKEIDWSKKLQKNKEKKTRDFHSPRQTRFWLRKKNNFLFALELIIVPHF